MNPVLLEEMYLKIDKADSMFSKYIRTRDRYTCVRCGVYSKKTQCSHYFGRRMESVRFDEENCDTLCFGCHRYWEKEDREAYREFKIKQLGQGRFDSLRLKSNLLHTKDRKMAYLYWSERLKELKKEKTPYK